MCTCVMHYILHCMRLLHVTGFLPAQRAILFGSGAHMYIVCVDRCMVSSCIRNTVYCCIAVYGVFT